MGEVRVWPIPPKPWPNTFLVNVMRQYWGAVDQYEVRWSRTERSSVPRGFRKELGSGEYISILAECPGYKGQHRLFHFNSPLFACMSLCYWGLRGLQPLDPSARGDWLRSWRKCFWGSSAFCKYRLKFLNVTLHVTCNTKVATRPLYVRFMLHWI